MKNYMLAQKKKIEIDKWNEGCRVKQDPGQVFVINWIDKNAAWFRDTWDQALCGHCCFVDECGYELKHHCVKYKSIK